MSRSPAAVSIARCCHSDGPRRYQRHGPCAGCALASCSLLLANAVQRCSSIRLPRTRLTWDRIWHQCHLSGLTCCSRSTASIRAMLTPTLNPEARP
jgi:hypothetical protein